MKFVFLMQPAFGHVLPTLSLARALLERGASVEFFGTEFVRKQIEANGVPYRPYSAVIDPSSPRRIGNPVARAEHLLRLMMAELPEFLQTLDALKPDGIIHDACAAHGVIAARQLGVPGIGVYTHFALHRQRGSGSRRFDLIQLGRVLRALPHAGRVRRLFRQIRQEYGVDVSPTALFCGCEALNLVFTSRHFQPNGDAYDDTFRFVGPQLASRTETAPDFPWDKLDNRPIVYISLGTAFGDTPGFYRRCFEAFRDNRFQVVISTGAALDPQVLGEPPPNVTVQSFVPQLELLQRASVFVSHGGMNSATESLWYGVPLVVTPQGAEQPLVAARVAQLGAGIYLPSYRATPKALRASVERVLSDERYRLNGAQIAESLRAAGGPEAAAAAVVAHVTSSQDK